MHSGDQSIDADKESRLSAVEKGTLQELHMKSEIIEKWRTGTSASSGEGSKLFKNSDTALMDELPSLFASFNSVVAIINES